MEFTMEQYRESAGFLRERLGDFAPKIAMVLGSGLGYLGDQVERPIFVDYRDIPHFKASTAPGHKGRLVFGFLEGQPVAVMQGRMHHYEGYSYEEVTYAVRVLRLLGCETLVVTNAAGCVNTSWQAGDLMLITDHIKLFSVSPLRGENLPEFGTRFPDASRLYTPRLQELARETAGRRRSWASLCGRGSTSTATAPSTRPPPRSGPPAFWGATRWACPPPPRWWRPDTAAWRCWGSPCSPTWPRAFWTSPSPSRRCWTPPRRPGRSSPGSFGRA